MTGGGAQKNREKMLYFNLALLLFAAIFMIALTVHMGCEIVRQLMWAETEGMVLDVTTQLKVDGDGYRYEAYTAAVDYYANGERYVSQLYNGAREVSVGNSVRFLRNLDDPTEIAMKNYWWWFGFAVTAPFTLFFIAALWKAIREARGFK